MSDRTHTNTPSGAQVTGTTYPPAGVPPHSSTTSTAAKPIPQDPDAIERDLHATRARLDNRLRELTARLSPGQIVDEALDFLRTKEGIDFTRRLSDSVRERPIPVALAGIGIAWLMAAGPRPHERVIYREGHVQRGPYRSGLGDTSVHPRGDQEDLVTRAWKAGKEVVRQAGESDADYRARVTEARAKVLGLTRQAQDTAQSFADRVEEALFSARDQLSDTAQAVRDRITEGAQALGDRMSDNVQGLRDMASGGYDQARRVGSRLADRTGSLVDTIGSNPILLGSLGVLTGALLGVMFPPTEVERSYLGETARSARDTAADMAQTAMDRGRDVAQKAAEAGGAAIRKATEAGREAVEKTADAANDPNRSLPQAAADAAKEATEKTAATAREAVSQTSQTARDSINSPKP